MASGQKARVSPPTHPSDLLPTSSSSPSVTLDSQEPGSSFASQSRQPFFLVSAAGLAKNTIPFFPISGQSTASRRASPIVTRALGIREP